jgi:hypothetical protein
MKEYNGQVFAESKEDPKSLFLNLLILIFLRRQGALSGNLVRMWMLIHAFSFIYS